MAGHAGDGEEAVVVWAVRNGLLLRLAAGAHWRSSSGQAGRRRPSRLNLHRAERRLPDGEGGGAGGGNGDYPIQPVYVEDLADQAEIAEGQRLPTSGLRSTGADDFRVLLPPAQNATPLT